ncbi:MAG: DUF6324 family protein [Pseudomonadota bacterium]
MGIDTESDVAASLTIGPTSEGMVRLYVETEAGNEIPMDFDPDEALEIAEEIAAAAEAARSGRARRAGGTGSGGGRGGRGPGQGAGRRQGNSG